MNKVIIDKVQLIMYAVIIIMAGILLLGSDFRQRLHKFVLPSQIQLTKIWAWAFAIYVSTHLEHFHNNHAY